jgi:rhamnose transport system ATP-binding protein
MIDVGKLSGGNQQKVMLAKWLETKPRLLIFDEPTRGIDVGAKAEVHNIIRDLASQGVAIIVISSDLPEVLALADRILVMREGRQMGIFPIAGATQENIIAVATGQASAEHMALAS